jgi:RNA polymerase sigma factor (TIGR02999 family)
MTEIEESLATTDDGDPREAERLLPLVYDELRRLAVRRLACESPGQTLQATALVHEAYLRLVDEGRVRDWDGRGHFFAAAAEAMRRILINRARNKRRLKRAGDRQRIDIDLVEISCETAVEDLLAIDEALERLGREDPACAELVKLRFFVGLTQEESARALGIPRRTADRHWAYARAWLFLQLRGADEGWGRRAGRKSEADGAG